MLGSERQREILNYLKLYGSVSVKKLTGLVYASEATVRRDLNELEKTGQIKRIFGGATLAVAPDRQVPLYVREKEDGAAKDAICRRASELLRDGAVLFLDGSSTAQTMVRYLPRFRDLIVLTNGLKIVEMLRELHIKVYCTGGLLREDSSVFVGKDALAFLDRFSVDFCFLSCKGMDAEGRLSDTSEEETELRKKVLAISETRVLLLTEQKLNKRYLHTLCHAGEIDHIFTDGILPEGLTLRRA